MMLNFKGTLSLLFLFACNCGSDSLQEPGTVHLKRPAPTILDSIPNIQSDSYGTFRTLSDLNNFWMKKITSVDNLRIRYRKNNQPSEKDSLHVLDSLFHQYSDNRLADISSFVLKGDRTRENFKGLLYLITGPKTDAALIDSLRSLFPEQVRNSADGILLAKLISERTGTRPTGRYNKALLSLPFQDNKSSKIKLEDVKSEYLLLDFWTSWCSPCRHENRFIQQNLTQIELPGLVTVVGVSLDANESKWLKANDADKISYLSIIDTRSFEAPLAVAFGVRRIPDNVLLDKQGNIVARDLWGQRLIDFVKELKHR